MKRNIILIIIILFMILGTSVFIFKYPKNQLATVEVSMVKSCSSGSNFFDNLELSIDNQTLAKEYIKEIQDNFYDTIKYQFGFDRADYNLDCIDIDYTRGGYFKAKGTYKGKSPFELFYHWGWCSSGGTDCGWSKCFSSTSNSLFESVKINSCNKIYSERYNDNYTCTGEAYNKTEEIQSRCNIGEFEKITGNGKSLSIIQNSNRCSSIASVGQFNC